MFGIILSRINGVNTISEVENYYYKIFLIELFYKWIIFEIIKIKIKKNLLNS
jgi:hypothetical protein